MSDFLAQPPPSLHGGMAYISPLDGMVIPSRDLSPIATMFSEIRRAGEMIKELRADIEALKAERVLVEAE